jgi:hypothetical protein
MVYHCLSILWLAQNQTQSPVLPEMGDIKNHPQIDPYIQHKISTNDT